MTSQVYGFSHLKSAQNWLARARVQLKFNNIETTTLCIGFCPICGGKIDCQKSVGEH